MEGVNLNCLTETERDAILSVIRRNDQLQQAEQQRISKLQSEVKFIRLKGVIKPGQDAAKSCARCRTPFGWFFNKGTICPQCQHRVCDTCQVSQEQEGKWLCVLCNKQMQLQAMTGDWFYSKFRKSKRHKRTNKVITGSEIVRTSIHRPNRPNRLTSCNTAATGAANSIGQEVKRALSNNNASPKLQRPPNMCVDGESSDTQSMEDSYSPRRQLQKDLEGAAYPKDSDRQKLLDLIRPKMPDSEFANGRNATSARLQVRVEVKQVSSNRYCDSDSSSDSETTNPSTPPFSRANDSFLTNESVRSSFRSTVSAISSEGPNTVVTEGISDLDIPTCSSASVSPTVFRKDVTVPNYHKDMQNERQYNSDKSRSNPSSSFTDGSGLLGISPTQARSEINDEKQPKQVARRSLTKQDSLVDSSDSEGDFTTEQITRMKFRRISVSKTEAVKTSSPKDQNSREVAPSTKPPDSPPQPEVIITDHDPSPALELTDPEPAPTPELSHPPDTVTPCVEVEPQTPSVEPRELEPEPELSTNKTEEEETRHNGRLSSSLKSTTQESENHNRTGCDAEVDIVVIPGGNDTRPRSPSSIPSPAMMHSKRALEGVCELDEDRQSSDSYPVTPRTDSPSSMSSLCSRGQQSTRSTNLLTPFSTSQLAVSTESMMSYYSDAGEGNYGKIPVTGEIQFGLDYNYKNSVFEVAIRQCKDVAAVDTKKKRSDPYVKTYLLPDRTKNGKRKTRVKKHTLNPVFDEILKYHVTKSELETRTLWVTVWHNDTFGRNDFLGEVTFPLDYYEFGDSSPQWYKLQERNPLPLSLLTYKGDLNLSLRFVSPENLPGRKKDGRCGSKGSLHVLIKQARNLTAVRANGSSDPFCKGYLLPDKIRRIKQKTPVLKKNCNPTWNHTMVFDNVSWDELRDYCLELTIWDFDRFTSNDFLGGVRFNLGSGKSGGKEVDWMDAKGDEISIWQSMLDRPNYWIDGTLMVRPNMDRRK